MKSQEALQRVKTAPEYCGENSVYKKYDNSYTPFMNDIELIEKDLDELSEYKKLEEKVGLSLFIINKALTEGIWFKYNPLKSILYVEPCDVHPTKGSYLRIFNSTILEFKDYGNTWALTKEELE